MPLFRKTVVPLVFLIATTLGYHIATYQFALLRIAEEFSLSTAQVGVLAGAIFMTQIFVPVIMGILADRHGKKPFIFVGCALLLTSIALFFAAGSYPAMLITALVSGAGFGTLEALYLSLMADVYPERVTRYINFSQTMFGVGAFIGPLIAAAMVRAGAEWRQVFLPVLIMQVCAVIMLVFTDTKPAQVQVREGGVQAPQSKKSPLFVFRQPLLYALVLWILLYVGVETATASFANLYLAQGFNMPDDLAALGLSLFWVMMVPSRLLFGLAKKNHMKMLLLFVVLLAASAVFAAVAANGVAALFCIALCGFFCGPIWPMIFSYNQQAFPEARATASSCCVAFSGAGGFLIPAVIGNIGEGRALSSIFFSIAVVSVLMLVFAAAARSGLKKRGIAPDAQVSAD